MASNERFDPNQPKHWRKCAEHINDESDANYVETESIGVEEPPRRRAKREQ
jgi:hypothetical protein